MPSPTHGFVFLYLAFFPGDGLYSTAPDTFFLTLYRRSLLGKLPPTLLSIKVDRTASRAERLRSTQKLLTSPSTMQISTVLLCLLLVATAFTSQVLSHPGFVPTSCCFEMANKRIPKPLLKSYRKITNSRCTMKAIVFKTKGGLEICADPKKKWVQDATKHLDHVLQISKP
ncbi:eotaxin [Sigmodon hispidus]